MSDHRPIRFLSIDLQNDFASEGGKHYTPKASVNFLKSTLIPYLQERGTKICEITSDYRQPRPGDRDESCVPGTWGYESVIPAELVSARWIKCMNSPVWVRDNGGDADKSPGLPHPDPDGFARWLDDNFGAPGSIKPVLIGLTIDCCVLSTLQELSWRGYYPAVLREGVDHYDGKIESRDRVLETVAPNWSEVVSWAELQKNSLK